MPSLTRLLILLSLFAIACKEKQPNTPTASTSHDAAADATPHQDPATPQPYPFGAPSQEQLVSDAIEALMAQDAQAYKKLHAPPEIIMEMCPDAFASKTAKELFERRYQKLEQALIQGMDDCKNLIDWSVTRELGREGGKRFESPPGCKEGVQRYEDIDIFLQVGDAQARLVLTNPVTFDGGETWVLDREPRCLPLLRQPTSPELLAKALEGVLRAQDDAGLLSLATEGRHLRAACPALSGPLFDQRAAFASLIDRQQRLKACKEHARLSDSVKPATLTLISQAPERVDGCDDSLWRSVYTLDFQEPGGHPIRFEALEHRGSYRTLFSLAKLPDCEPPQQ